MNKKLLWIYILSGSIYFTQGIEGLPSLSLFFHLKENLHYSPSTIMYIGSLTSIAWIIKIFWGYLVDNYLSSKRWITLSLISSLLICLFLGLSPIIPIFILIPLLMLGNMNTALRDVANDGMMCVEGKKAGECASIQTVQWISITIASIIVGLGGGYLADHFNYKISYLCLIPIYLIIMGIVSKYKGSKAKRETLKTQKPLATLVSYKELFINKQFLLGCLFIFTYNFAPGFGTPLMFIQRDVFKWSGTFMGVIAAISSILSIVGAILYFKFNKKINIKKCLFWSVFLVGTTNLCYLYFTPLSSIIYSFVFSILGMFIFLNMMSYMAKSTLAGKEAVSFALLCSCNNLSATCSSLVGAWLYPLLGLKTIIVLAAISAFLSLPILKKIKI